MHLSQVIFLLGPMGAGKTTVGRALAQDLGVDFLDHDELLVALEGCLIPEIFDKHGEAYFRQLEHDCLSAVIAGDQSRFSAEQLQAALNGKKPLVIAGGGGIAGRADNRALLKDHCCCIYLQLPVVVQYSRVKDDNNRPMIHVSDIHARLQELMEQRDPQWREIASAIIESDAPIEQIVAQCRSLLKL